MTAPAAFHWAAGACILFAAAALVQFVVRVSRWIHQTHGDET